MASGFPILFGAPPFGNEDRDQWIRVLTLFLQDPFATHAAIVGGTQITTSGWNVPATSITGTIPGGVDQSAIDALQAQINALALSLGVPFGTSPDYSNPGGEGDRRSLITMSSSSALSSGTADLLVNGVYFDPTLVTVGSAVAGAWIRLAFTKPVVITEMAMDMGAGSNGSWIIQAGQDGTSWVDLSSTLTFTTPGGTGSGGGSSQSTRTNQWIIDLSGNIFAWKYYRLLGVSGTGGATYLNELNLKIWGL